MASDFINFVLEMRSGAVAADINSKFNELLQAVMETTGKGELTINLLRADVAEREGFAFIRESIETNLATTSISGSPAATV